MKITKCKIFLLLLALTVIFFHKFVFNSGRIVYPAPDIFYASYIEKVLFSHSLIDYKSLPFWNPYIFGGSPFLGNPTSAMFYPLNLLFTLLPIGSVFGYMFAIDSFLIGIFTYLFARTIKIDKFGSLISAVTIMFSGPLSASVFAGHPILSDTFIWLPLAFIFFELMITRRKSVFAVLAGLTIALMSFAGSPQTTIHQVISLLLYFVLRSFFAVKNVREFLLLSVLPITSIVIGFLTAAAQLLPSSEFSKLSQRGDNGLSYVFASDFSLHPYQILSFIFPYFFGSPTNGTYWAKGNFWELNGYIGILPLLLALLAIFLKRNRYVFIFLAIGVFAILYSFGKYSYLFPFFFYHIPGFNNFRTPSRFLFIYVFSFSILAGIGANYLLGNFINRMKKQIIKVKYIFPLTISTFIGLILFLKESDKGIEFYEQYVLRNSFAVGIDNTTLYAQSLNDIFVFLIMISLAYLALILREKKMIGINHLKMFIVFLVFFDLWLFGSRFIGTKKINDILKSTPILNKITEDKTTYRVFDLEGDYLPLLAVNKIESITGVHPLYLKDTRDFLWSIGKHSNTPYESSFQITSISNPVFLNLLNVKYVITNKRLNVQGLGEELKLNAPISYFPRQNPSYYLYKNENVLPRAYIVPNAIVWENKKTTLSMLIKNNFNPKDYVILENKPKNAKLNNFSKFTEINLANNNFNKLSLSLNLTEPGFLVLSEIYYPGWRAYDNNKETEIFKANYIFRSIYLDPGIHKIVFLYSPNTYKIGGIISAITILVCLIYILNKRKDLSAKDVRN